MNAIQLLFYISSILLLSLYLVFNKINLLRSSRISDGILCSIILFDGLYVDRFPSYRTGPLIAMVGVEIRVEWEADSMNFLLCLLKLCRTTITNQTLVDREGSSCARVPLAHIHSHRPELRVFLLNHQSENFILN